MRIDLHLLRLPLIFIGVFIVLQSASFWLLYTASSNAQAVSRQLAWMEKQQDVVNWIKSKPDTVTLSKPLVEAVTESAIEAGIVLSSKVSGGDTVQISLTGVEFNRLILWLQQLQHTYCTVVLVLDLTRGAAGEVNVTRLVLGRPPRVK
ncbi:type II secretion system protein GspM [Symbiopectobacterium purcellii]|uniref:type II secretion system protein GspM n=1 Tax=Symbiopectobacterium purcellii TaxID=2871826 RepID=UPI003F83CA17